MTSPSQTSDPSTQSRGRPRFLGDDGAVLPQHRVQQGGLAGIRSTHYCDLPAVSTSASPFECLQQLLGLTDGAGHDATNLFQLVGTHILDEVQSRLELNQGLGQPLPQGADHLGQAPRHCPVRGLQTTPAAGKDQIDHGLGLKEIDPSIDEGASCELPRLGHPCSKVDGRIEHDFEEDIAAVRRDLDSILPSVRLRALEIPCQGRVQGLPVPVHYTSMVDVAGTSQPRPREENARPDCQGTGTTQAEQCNTTWPTGSGDGNDCG